MQFVKTRANELAILGKPMDRGDLIEMILNGLNNEYKSIINVVNGYDVPIFFDELHKKLINKELSSYLQHLSSSPLPAIVNTTRSRSNIENLKGKDKKLP